MILEGSYPYVRGGVSSWAHQLILGLPAVSFSLLTLVARKEDLKRAYSLPANVLAVEEIVLSDPPPLDNPRSALPENIIQKVRTMHQLFQENRADSAALMKELLGHPGCSGPGNGSLFELLASRPAWDLLIELYRTRKMEECSFNAYYYTFLHSHIRFFRAIGAAYPPARAYHAISTGYAGVAGVAASLATRRPLMLTEHGIYTNERSIDITTSEWLEGASTEEGIVLSAAPGKIRNVWMRMFEYMGFLTYDRATIITTLFEGNRRMQIELGADPAKIEVVPNGTELARLGALPRRPDPAQPRICLVGRVVPIKDVRTFVKACAIVAARYPECRFDILGPTEEDRIYSDGCRDLALELGLESRLRFLGHVDLTDHLPYMTLAVLTSMSEGLPLAMLETMACGIPNVASRVGACEELISGKTAEDRALGPAGILTGVSSPEETAAAIVLLLGDPALRARMAVTARERVARLYDQVAVLNRYRQLYRQLVELPDC